MADDSESFYAGVLSFSAFSTLMEPAHYAPLPDDWSVGIADVIQSTKAIEAKRYKAVNMAGAAVIAAVTNALGEREFPFVFGGDGASFAVAPARSRESTRGARRDRGLGRQRTRSHDAGRAGAGRATSARTALDVRVARYGPSDERVLRHVFRRRPAWADAP